MTAQTGRASGRSTTPDDPVRGFVYFPWPTEALYRNLQPGDFLPRLDAAPQHLGGRIARVMLEQVRSHLL